MIIQIATFLWISGKLWILMDFSEKQVPQFVLSRGFKSAFRIVQHFLTICPMFSRHNFSCWHFLQVRVSPVSNSGLWFCWFSFFQKSCFPVWCEKIATLFPGWKMKWKRMLLWHFCFDQGGFASLLPRKLSPTSTGDHFPGVRWLFRANFHVKLESKQCSLA